MLVQFNVKPARSDISCRVVCDFTTDLAPGLKPHSGLLIHLL